MFIIAAQDTTPLWEENPASFLSSDPTFVPIGYFWGVLLFFFCIALILAIGCYLLGRYHARHRRGRLRPLTDLEWEQTLRRTHRAPHPSRTVQ